MKILFYISTIRGGGAAKVMTNIANQYSNRGYDVVFVTNFSDSHEYNINSNISRYNIEEKESKSNVFLKNYKRISMLRKIIKREKADVVISFMGENNFRAIIATLFLRVKTIISVRNDPNKEYSNKISRLLAKVLYRLSDGCVFQTEDAKKWFPLSIQKKSAIILNQVDEKYFSVKRANSTSGIVTLGRLSEQKNHIMLIDAYAKISDSIDDDLYIYGEGNLYNKLTMYVNKLNLQDRIHFMGYTDKPEDVFKTAKLLVLSSDYEGLPNVIMEAMTCGVPCISTDCPCGGPKMLIKNNVNGILVKMGDSDELSHEIKKLINDEQLISTISLNARARAKDFNSDRIFEIWERFINRI